jgi:hypothetical protein
MKDLPASFPDEKSGPGLQQQSSAAAFHRFPVFKPGRLLK